MAQRLALLSIFCCCILGSFASEGPQSLVHEQQLLEDSEALVQTLAHVSFEGDKPNKNRKTVRELVLMVDQKVKDLQKRQLQNLTTKLKTKFQEVMEKSRVAQEEKLNRTEAPVVDEAEQVEEEEEEVVEPSTPPPPSAEEIREAKRAKFGDVISLVVRNPLDGDVNVTFRTSTRMHVLFASLCKRARVHRSDAHFFHEGRELVDDDTLESVGLGAGSVIDLVAKPLQFMKEAKERQTMDLDLARKSQMEAAAKAEVEVYEAQRQELKTNLQRQKEQDAIARAAQKNKVQRMKEQRRRKENMVNLKFVDPYGDQINMQVKRDRALDHIFTLACKRLGIPEEKAAFYFGPEHKRISHKGGTVQTLGLHHNAVIEVRKPFVAKK